uniref:Uncharacterized protein n=1 Tax=uncultured marine virus TaxID=186617 RepID=A0A0F7L920_9VIRU|nr:hypothetical protein [uncultured marine virus]
MPAIPEDASAPGIVCARPRRPVGHQSGPPADGHCRVSSQPIGRRRACVERIGALCVCAVLPCVALIERSVHRPKTALRACVPITDDEPHGPVFVSPCCHVVQCSDRAVRL